MKPCPINHDNNEYNWWNLVFAEAKMDDCIRGQPQTGRRISNSPNDVSDPELSKQLRKPRTRRVKRQNSRLTPSAPPMDEDVYPETQHYPHIQPAYDSDNSQCLTTSNPNLYGSQSVPAYGAVSPEQITVTPSSRQVHYKRAAADYVKTGKKKYKKGQNPRQQSGMYKSADDLSQSTGNINHRYSCGSEGNNSQASSAGQLSIIGRENGRSENNHNWNHPANPMVAAVNNQVPIAGTPAGITLQQVLPCISFNSLNTSTPILAYTPVTDQMMSQSSQQMAFVPMSHGQPISMIPSSQAASQPIGTSSPNLGHRTTQTQSHTGNGHAVTLHHDNHSISRSTIELGENELNLSPSTTTSTRTLMRTEQRYYAEDFDKPAQWTSKIYLIISALCAIINPLSGIVAVFFASKLGLSFRQLMYENYK